MKPHTQKYFYYLHQSRAFQKDREEYLKLETAGKVVASQKLFTQLKEKYEIPERAIGEFIVLLHQKTTPFTSTGLHIVRENETRTLEVQGPAIALVIPHRLSKPEFYALWEQFNHYQNWEVKLMDMPAQLGEAFKRTDFRMPEDFDLAFELYRIKRENPKTTYAQIAEANRDKLGATHGVEFVEYKVRFIRNLIKETQNRD